MASAARAPAASAPAFWWACALLAPPIAFAASRAGLAMATPDPWRDVPLLVLVSVAEEIVFRGAVQALLARAFAPRDALAGPLSASNVVTSAVFAAAHLWQHPPLAALAVFPVSLVYGRARELGGRVAPAAFLHAGFNVLLYAASWLGARA